MPLDHAPEGLADALSEGLAVLGAGEGGVVRPAPVLLYDLRVLLHQLAIGDARELAEVVLLDAGKLGHLQARRLGDSARRQTGAPDRAAVEGGQRQGPQPLGQEAALLEAALRQGVLALALEPQLGVTLGLAMTDEQ